jgi:hypothetical protein
MAAPGTRNQLMCRQLRTVPDRNSTSSETSARARLKESISRAALGDGSRLQHLGCRRHGAEGRRARARRNGIRQTADTHVRGGYECDCD